MLVSLLSPISHSSCSAYSFPALAVGFPFRAMLAKRVPAPSSAQSGAAAASLKRKSSSDLSAAPAPTNVSAATSAPVAAVDPARRGTPPSTGEHKQRGSPASAASASASMNADEDDDDPFGFSSSSSSTGTPTAAPLASPLPPPSSRKASATLQSLGLGGLGAKPKPSSYTSNLLSAQQPSNKRAKKNSATTTGASTLPFVARSRASFVEDTESADDDAATALASSASAASTDAAASSSAVVASAASSSPSTPTAFSSSSSSVAAVVPVVASSQASLEDFFCASSSSSRARPGAEPSWRRHHAVTDGRDQCCPRCEELLLGCTLKDHEKVCRPVPEPLRFSLACAAQAEQFVAPQHLASRLQHASSQPHLAGSTLWRIPSLARLPCDADRRKVTRILRWVSSVLRSREGRDLAREDAATALALDSSSFCCSSATSGADGPQPDSYPDPDPEWTLAPNQELWVFCTPRHSHSEVAAAVVVHTSLHDLCNLATNTVPTKISHAPGAATKQRGIQGFYASGANNSNNNNNNGNNPSGTTVAAAADAAESSTTPPAAAAASPSPVLDLGVASSSAASSPSSLAAPSAAAGGAAPASSSSSSSSCSDSPVSSGSSLLPLRPLFGVDKIVVHAQYRFRPAMRGAQQPSSSSASAASSGSSIAAHVLTCILACHAAERGVSAAAAAAASSSSAAASLSASSLLPFRRVAFSDPTAAGRKFAARFTGTSAFTTYSLPILASKHKQQQQQQQHAE